MVETGVDGSSAATATAAATATPAGAAPVPVDGRSARRERNQHAVLDAVIALFTEGQMGPSVERVAERSGVSVRSIYRYFPEPADLLDAAIRRHRAQTSALARLHAIGEGPLADRVDALIEVRLRLHGQVGATYRASVHNAPTNPRLTDALARGRHELRAQFERQFEPELLARPAADRRAIATAGDLLTQLDSIDLLRQDQGLSPARTAATLRAALLALLAVDQTPDPAAATDRQDPDR